MRLRVTLPDFHRAIKFIGDFQNFQLQILVERLRAQKCVNLCLSFGGLLTSDKRVEPAQEKKDFAFPLDLRQGFERRFQKGQRQLGLVPVIKRSQALLDPVFRARRNLQIIGEIALLGRAFRPRGFGHVGVLLAIAGVVALLFGGEESLSFRIIQSNERSEDRPAIQGAKFYTRNGELSS